MSDIAAIIILVIVFSFWFYPEKFGETIKTNIELFQSGFTDEAH